MLAALAEFRDGASLAEVIARTEFPRTTAHRTLQSLQDVRYVFQDPETRRYFFGSALANLARRANQSDIAALSSRAMKRLAELSEDTILLSIPEGSESVCVGVEQGAYPIRAVPLSVGDRVPLGVGSTAQALYAVMPESKRKVALRVNGNWIRSFGFTAETVEERRADFTRRGYAHTPGLVVPGMTAVGLPIVTASGKIAGAIGIAAIDSRMTSDRVERTLLPAMRTEVALLTERFESLEEEGLI